ncbi:MAG TPA: sulfotransferase [Steroidobacteraceae bacterium]|jgi:tetratricopeptide (TPR) repeat protein|nr:sulfotransferase [Steroidobacteraceae bacterium]
MTDSRAFQARGDALYAAGDYPNALEAYRAALALNVSLIDCWHKYVDCLSRTGRLDLAADARRQAEQMEALPAQVLSAHDDLAGGNIDRAESTIRAFLQQHGIHVEGMRVMALVAARREVLEVAEELLAQVLRRAPEHVAARGEYVSVLIRLQRYADALPHAEQVLRAHPERRDYRLLYAETLAGLNRYREVIDIHQSLLAGASDPAFHYLAMGHARRGLGLVDLAIADYVQAIAARPAYGEAWWSLANLKVHRFTPEQQRALRQALDAPRLEENDRIGLHFAYAKSLEDERHFDESLQHYTQGNALKARLAPYLPDVIDRIVGESRELFTAEFFAKRAAWGHPDSSPIFIVGLPRSGSTLVEQVLASHPAIDGTMELPQINHLIQGLCSAARPGQGLRPYPSALAALDCNAVATLGRLYVEKTRPFRTGRPHFTDKMGENFLHVGFIRLILPQARIIDVRRDPMACCFSNYKQLFPAGNFSYDFESLAHFYTRYIAMSQHWDSVLPGGVYRLHYEQLVRNFEPEVRRLLDHLELPFDDHCLTFHDSANRAHTASSEQVRRPVNTDGVGQWRHFQQGLEPLRRHLRQEAQAAGVEDLLRKSLSH